MMLATACALLAITMLPAFQCVAAEAAQSTMTQPKAGPRWTSFLLQHVSDKDLGRRFREQTAKDVEVLASDQKAALADVRESVFGADVPAERVAAADQLVVCGNRDAMLLAILQRKQWKVEQALLGLNDVVNWRIRDNVEDIFNETRLDREKVKKHRECWPTAFYPRDLHGDPIFVDRMGILDLTGLKAEPLPLDLNEMLTYYVMTMEARRRLLLPHLSRESGRLITKYTSVIDVSSFGGQHFGPMALKFMSEMGKIFSENYADMMSALYIINAPWGFSRVWAIIRTMVGDETMSKIKILDRKAAYVELAKVMPPEVVEAVIEGPLKRERQDEKELHALQDGLARSGAHRRQNWG